MDYLIGENFFFTGIKNTQQLAWNVFFIGTIYFYLAALNKNQFKSTIE